VIHGLRSTVKNTQVLQMGELPGAPAQAELSPRKPCSLFAEDMSIPKPNAEVLTGARCREESPEPGDGVLSVMGVAELTAAHGSRFREQVRAALIAHTVIEIDLSRTTSMDCAGLGALIAIRNLTSERKGVVRLVNPTSGVRQLLDLMRAGEIFEIVHTPM
jgi:anti-anti-sigma factor